MEYDLLGLGTSTLDIISLVDHFSSEETVQEASECVLQGGEPIGTAMVTLARLGIRVAILDVLGEDWRGKLIKEEFGKEKVNTQLLILRSGETSTISTILVRKKDGARVIVFKRGTAQELSPEEISPSVILSAKYIHINGRHWDACMYACKIARENGVKVSFDGGAHRFETKMKELVPQIDVCIVAWDFAQKYTQSGKILDAGELLLKEGPSLVVITDGERGSFVFPQGKLHFHQPAFLLNEVVDTTGCGDSYHGAFLFGLIKGMALKATARFASAVAAMNARFLGGRRGLPTLEQVYFKIVISEKRLFKRMRGLI